ERRELLDAVDDARRNFDSHAAIDTWSTLQKRAISLLASSGTAAAFDVTSEPAKLRKRYGENVNGMSLLLARRLVEAGVPFITVFWKEDRPRLGKKCKSAGGWDTHGNNFSCLKDNLLPVFDRAFSALIEDLSGRGLLDQTLLLVTSEMGRKPKIGDPRSGGTSGAGRDHWTHCLTDILAGGGILTAEDLSAYQAVTREPIRFNVDDWEIATNPLPAVGGVAAAAMLLLALNPPFAGWTSEEIDRLARIQRGVLGFRSDRLDDYEGRSAAADEILALAHAGDLTALDRSPSTVHTSATDSDGAGCAVTVSAGYGSGAVVPGTGMYLNNSLGEVELLVDGFHSLTPGTRLVSNMAPTVGRRADGSVIAIGTPGASRITTAISQVLINFLHLGMSLSDAVAHPRMHVEAFDGKPTIAYEPGLDVRPIGDMSARRFPDISMYFGGVQAALWDPVGGLYGAADPRRSGGTARGGVD
ncbi:MAG: gamma-glutamyltransferase, partial [Acidobacteria bacterium]|nr:gamma-glutamyltransferase [Acidobacteriota bacterium]